MLAPFMPAAGLSEFQLEQLNAYLNLLIKWNQKTNLTSVRRPEEIVRRHFGESLFLAAALPNPPNTLPDGMPVRLIDVGSGAGFPAIPAKIFLPQLAATLIESQNKKATFLKEVIRGLKLGSTIVFNGRAEEWLRAGGSQGEIVTLRAVEHFEEMLPVAQSLLAPGGRLALLIGARQLDTARKLLPSLDWEPARPLPLSESRVLLVGALPR